MNCPKCNKKLSLTSLDMIEEDTCSHCGFYFYIGNILKLMFIANLKVNQNEDFYFWNVHQRIYDPFLKSYKGEPKKGAEIIIDKYLKDFKELIYGYAKEDLQFMALSLREISTWHVFSDNVWESTHLRNISHVFTTLLEITDEESFGDFMITDDQDLISILVICEELAGITSNIKLNDYFSWNVDIEEMLKTKIENTRLEWFHNMFESKEFVKPEEIEFKEGSRINNYLQSRGLEMKKLKSDVSKEIESLYGFSFEDLHTFRDEIISISETYEQVHEISPKIDGHSMKCFFMFDSQFVEIGLPQKKIEQIINYFKYKPLEYSKINLSNPHMDYKFIFEYDNFIAFGLLDSANSITIFENLAMSDHFIEDLFGRKATIPFKKAQEKISTLIAYKIASYFQEKSDYYVPKIEADIPYVNIKMIKGRSINRKIMNEHNQDLGDLDAVVVDKARRKIIIIEIKYYKPASELTEVLKKDKKIFEDIEKIRRRATWVSQNVKDIIVAWDLDDCDYGVETYLVTARPNYFGKQIEDENANIKYFTLDSILNL